ncbi:hypothetical protein [Archangium sp.]|uniref:hypothetical protein n=1 Tax=Archangium sp. TaxID=1872627 RepID=UPI002D3C2462|nr:hypothetical protein [Archangium sp.]HYO54539.1 hypothetical protein [Archangium sp.]
MKWLGLGAAVWVSGGCLIPQNESYLNELPIQRNRPPRIVEKQVQPSERIIRGYGSDLCELEFSVIVEDPDVGNRLTAYWFVDYDSNQPRGADQVVRIEPKSGKVVRDERASFQASFDSADFNRLNLPGDHVIEVVVSDTALVDREPQGTLIKLPDGTDFTDPGYTATYAWFVRTEAGGGCP